jgi:hypothetical protein
MTTIGRVLASAAAPVLTGVLLAASPSAPFVLAGGIKIVYDFGLLAAFRKVKPPEEQ